MKYTDEQFAQVLYEVFQDTAPHDYDKVINNFIDILQTNNALERYESIITKYEEYQKQQSDKPQIEITTAKPLDTNDKIFKELNQLVQKDAVIKQKVDANLIGGVLLKIDDKQIDGSIKHHLDNLDNTLKQ